MIQFHVAIQPEKCVIDLKGDGTTREVEMDLSKAPFNGNFGGHFPTDISIQMIDGAAPARAGLMGSVLKLVFDEPLPTVEAGSPGHPRTKFDLYLWFS